MIGLRWLTAAGTVAAFLPLSFSMPSLPGGTAGGAGIVLTAACAQDSEPLDEDDPSCRPRPGWDCIHGTVVRTDKCDPDSKGCTQED